VKLFFLLFPLLLFCKEEEKVSQLQALLVIGDHQLAMIQAHEALQQNSRSIPIYLTAIKIFAEAGAEEQMMASFRAYQHLAKDDQFPRDTLEEMAWGVIEKGSKGTAPLTRAIALIASAMGNDARGVNILIQNSGDSHRLIRALVAEFSSHFRDEALQEMVKERLEVEKDVNVRLALLQAIGPMKIESMEPQLLAILENSNASAEEKFASIASLVELKDKVAPAEIQKLVQSNRAGLRMLAAELVSVHDKKEDAGLILPLLNDPNGDVRRGALETLGGLRIQQINGISLPELISNLLNDPVPEVAITASWVLMLYHPEQGQAYMKRWLKSLHPDERLYAACALKGAGKYGYPLNLNIFKETDDPFVKLNLGMVLIHEQINPALGTEGIYQAVMHQKERWMECEFGRFSGIGPSKVNHRPDIPHYPEAVNQMTRLEMLNLLAVQKHPGALDAVLHFLKERGWGVTGAASALLLTEGDEEMLGLIRQLLKDESEKVQLQAALILAMWGNDAEALSTLQRLYFKSTHSKKEQIIEALGRLGDFSAVPFLVDRLEEPHQSLRMISAAALLQTLYH
jgi:HEAT repeat protein